MRWVGLAWGGGRRACLARGRLYASWERARGGAVRCGHVGRGQGHGRCDGSKEGGCSGPYAPPNGLPCAIISPRPTHAPAPHCARAPSGPARFAPPPRPALLQVGAHGTGASIPPVDEQVVAMRLVTPGAGTLTLSSRWVDAVQHCTVPAAAAAYVFSCLTGCLVAPLVCCCWPLHRWGKPVLDCCVFGSRVACPCMRV